MIYETGDIKEAIREYYEREIEDKNLVYKGRTVRIDALHKWRDEDLERLSELERRAEAFDGLQEGLKKIIDEYDKKARAEFKNGFIGPATEAIDIKNKIKNIVSHESEAE